MLDTHCHVDLIDDPVAFAKRLEHALSTCVAVTMLPEHFKQARHHLSGFRNVVPALGAHPIRCRDAERQVSQFCAEAKSTAYIGEIGLDGSYEGKATLAKQKVMFRTILGAIQLGSFVTIHSRGAWKETWEMVEEAKIGPVCFHYFTGGSAAAETVVRSGHFLSINHKMVSADSRHCEWVRALPVNRVLVESDAPFTGNGDPVKQVLSVYDFLSDSWKIDRHQVEAQVETNFQMCRTT
jgi:TatD DNase family protein